METQPAISYFALIMSFLSFVLSGWIAYRAHLGSAKPGIAIGRSLEFYPLPRLTPSEPEWGGVGFYVPMTFYNRGARACSIREVRMIIQLKEYPTRCFDIAWTEFAKVSTYPETLQRFFETKSKAHPIALDGHSSTSETVQFAWDPRTNDDMDLSSGQYEFTLLVWTDDGDQPIIRETFPFRISGEKEAEFKKNIENRMPLTIDVPIGESRRNNSVLTREQANQLYGF